MAGSKIPRLLFNPSRRALFAYVNLMRTLIFEAIPLKEGDGMDFCHAVMASAFASFATLDKHWKRRVVSLSTPNSLACSHSGPEFDNMVTHIESWVTRGATLPPEIAPVAIPCMPCPRHHPNVRRAGSNSQQFGNSIPPA
jgi:hypothetical protein